MQRPFLSVIVPTHNRPAAITACLEALASVDYPSDRFEVIVVNGGGENPESVVAPFRARLNLTVVGERHAGPAAARNSGAALARGDLLVFTDDDCRPERGWLQALSERFSAAADRAIGGLTVNALQNNPYATASQLLIDYLYGYYNIDPSRAVFFTSNNLAFPAERFRALGGFDPAFRQAAAEDRDLCDRWLHHGYAMWYAPDAVVAHGHALTCGGFLRQHFRYGCGAFTFHGARARRAESPVRVEPARFYADLLRYPFREARGLRGVGLAALMAASQVANAAGFAWAYVRDGVRAGR